MGSSQSSQSSQSSNTTSVGYTIRIIETDGFEEHRTVWR